MGRGDKRSRRGKIWRGSHGKTRPAGKGKPSKEEKPLGPVVKREVVKKEAPKKEVHKKETPKKEVTKKGVVKKEKETKEKVVRKRTTKKTEAEGESA